ncbi:MAG: hypothetical protein HC849_12980 [Oscillatoriales cyanobacterium RU_3_3]|nr:hypothetical protein [Microcoleus sp. SU_5_6]NJL65889.1 hypothetical protein [Microcoleus sp. SM1_3_4]NJM60908.1 hypothetical protein [Oscillatoriales cyanobacterium RU_3_3]NJR21744.1 hypothetical protein [Richelia sp. CSU_2_1]
MSVVISNVIVRTVPYKLRLNNCSLSTVNCQLSTVNCFRSPTHSQIR